LGAVLFSLFAVLATAIAAVGVYSAIAASLQERRSELGIRRALGASSARVAVFVAGEDLGVALIGALGGIVAGTLLAPQVISFLVRVSPRDPTVVAVAGAVSLVASIAASLPPVLQAVISQPADLIRMR
jgi:ABC-type antimicrobial peptide transport system permease subunit